MKKQVVNPKAQDTGVIESILDRVKDEVELIKEGTTFYLVLN
jgi:Delta3-Delta2-enoyl-CoA isomerase